MRLRIFKQISNFEKAVTLKQGNFSQLQDLRWQNNFQKSQVFKTRENIAVTHSKCIKLGEQRI